VLWRVSSVDQRREPLKLKSAFLALLIVPLFSACSWVVVDGPPVGYERFNSVPCTRSKFMPSVDAASSALATWMGTMMILEENPFPFADGFQEHLGITKGGGVVTAMSYGVLSGYSAYVGFQRTTACREAQLEIAARNRQAAALYRDESPQSSEYAWLDQLVPAPIFAADLPDLPVTIPLLRK
jgi:hypothetical protein